MDLENAIALLNRLSLQEGVDPVAALLVRRLEMLLLDLQASLAEHGGALDVAVSNCEVEWVLSFIRLRVQLKVHGPLD